MKIEYDNALNEAGLKFIELWDGEKYGKMTGRLFNDVKIILKEVIETYLEESNAPR